MYCEPRWARKEKLKDIQINLKKFEIYFLLSKSESVKIYWLSVKFDWFK